MASSLLRFALLLIAAGALPGAGRAAAPPLPATLDTRFLLHFADGSEARLAGIAVPGCREEERRWEAWCAMALEAARGFLSSPDLVVEVLGHDRWQRPLVAIRRLAGPDLQGLLLDLGLALFDPLDVPYERVAAWREAEGRARQQGLGIWAASAGLVERAETVLAMPVRFRLVCGRVEQAQDVGPWLYLDFGRERRRDFTVRVASAVARRLRRDGLDLSLLAGRELCVRGWIFEAGGGTIDVVHGLQIEVRP